MKQVKIKIKIKKSLFLAITVSVFVLVLSPIGIASSVLAVSARTSGFNHGCADARISDPSARYINQPGKEARFHTTAFMQGYNNGFAACSGGGGTNPSPGGRASGGFHVVGVTLDTPESFTGACPHTIAFSGSITVAGGAGTVSYQIVDSDGRRTTEIPLHFDRAGTQPVHQSVQYTTFYGTATIHTSSPAQQQSSPVTFHVTCT